MARPERPYARVYFDDLQRDYPDIYADDAALAAWLRLLVIAEKMWPSVPEVPRSIRPRALYSLVDAGLVERMPPHCYRIKGLDAERTRRQESARNAAGVRWQSDRNAAGNAEPMPSTRRDENETKIPPPPTRGGRRKDGTNPRQTGTEPRSNGTNPRAIGTSTRQVRKAEKRGGFPASIHDILQAAAEGKKA
jgi:hypothetical protein